MPLVSIQSPQTFAPIAIILAIQISTPATEALPSHLMVTWSKNHITKLKKFTDGTFQYPLPSALLADGVGFASLTEPMCYTSIVKDPHWHAAMNLEFDALLENQTWVLVLLTLLQILLDANGCFGSKDMQITPLNATKPV